MPTLVLADDHTVVRQGIRALLETEEDFQVIGEAGEGLEAIHLVERLKPDVLIVDVRMPGVGGLEVARQVCQRVAHTRVVILSMYDAEAYVQEALKHGALGYVLKCSESIHLIQAIREALAGRHYLSPPLSKRAVEAYVQEAKASSMHNRYETLTARERVVLNLVVHGLTNTEIARRLYISPRTVETHRAHLMRKLGLHKQADLIRYAIRRGILPVEEEEDEHEDAPQ